MPHDPKVQSLKGKLGRQRQLHPDADDTASREQLRLAMYEAEVRRIADSLPPLTAEQRMRLCAILLNSENRQLRCDS